MRQFKALFIAAVFCVVQAADAKTSLKEMSDRVELGWSDIGQVLACNFLHPEMNAGQLPIRYEASIRRYISVSGYVTDDFEDVQMRKIKLAMRMALDDLTYFAKKDPSYSTKSCVELIAHAEKLHAAMERKIREAGKQRK